MREKKKSRWTRKASFTVEVSVIMCIFLVLIAGLSDLSLQLYRENMEQIRNYRKEAWIEVPSALRIRHLGGAVYEQYRIQHNL